MQSPSDMHQGQYPLPKWPHLGFPDLSAKVLDVKRLLLIYHLKYAMLFPAQLRIVGAMTGHTFLMTQSLPWLGWINVMDIEIVLHIM